MTDAPKRRGRPPKVRPADDRFNGAPPEAFDHDGDGRPGGSLPHVALEPKPEPVARKSAVSLFEQNAIAREAFEAYDMQDDRIRFDSQGRKWDFRMDKETGHWLLRLNVKRGLSEATEYVRQQDLGATKGFDLIEAAIKRMDGAVQ